MGKVTLHTQLRLSMRICCVIPGHPPHHILCETGMNATPKPRQILRREPLLKAAHVPQDRYGDNCRSMPLNGVTCLGGHVQDYTTRRRGPKAHAVTTWLQVTQLGALPLTLRSKILLLCKKDLRFSWR
jgi:hypothetical protein